MPIILKNFWQWQSHFNGEFWFAIYRNTDFSWKLFYKEKTGENIYEAAAASQTTSRRHWPLGLLSPDQRKLLTWDSTLSDTVWMEASPPPRHNCTVIFASSSPRAEYRPMIIPILAVRQDRTVCLALNNTAGQWRQDTSHNPVSHGIGQRHGNLITNEQMEIHFTELSQLPSGCYVTKQTETRAGILSWCCPITVWWRDSPSQLTQFSVMKTMTCLFSQACLGYHLSSFPTWTHRHTSYTSIGGDKTLVIPTQHSLLHTRLARSDGILCVQAKITWENFLSLWSLVLVFSP